MIKNPQRILDTAVKTVGNLTNCSHAMRALPVLLVLGLFGRFAALGLSVINVVAVLSLMDLPDAALTGHLFWGSLLLALLLWGPGRWALDRFVIPSLRARVCGQHAEPAAPRLVPGPSARR